TGLASAGTAVPDSSGMINLPGVGPVSASSSEVKIPGTKYKYKLKHNPDGSISFKLKKPGFWSKLGSFLKKSIAAFAPLLNMIPLVGPALSQFVTQLGSSLGGGSGTSPSVAAATTVPKPLPNLTPAQNPFVLPSTTAATVLSFPQRFS